MNNQTGQMDNLDITPEQHQELKQLLQQHLPNTKVWAYGSRVTFKARPASDLDLVVFATKEQDRAVWSLRDALEESDLPFSVDVLVWDAIPEHFKPNIQQAYYQVQEYNSEVSGNIVLVPKDWSTRLLSDLVIENGGVQTGPFGSQLHQRDYVEIGTPIITVEHLGENRIRHKNLPCVSDADRDRLSKYSLSVGDIVFSRVGAVDRRSIVRQPENGWLFSGRCLRVRASPDKIEPMYLAYFLGAPKVKQYIRSIAVGATMPSINTKILSELPISFPPCLKTQKAISHVLGTLDDKIELNQKINRVLEDIAKALFKSWFIDFDPVRAKAEGRPTGLPPEISDLFPDKMVESEIGEIPKGWGLNSLGDYVSLTKGRSYRKVELQESQVALITLKSFMRGGGYRYDGLKPYIGKFNSEQIVKEGDLIIALTDVTQAADVIGKPAIARGSSSHDTLVASLDVGIVRPSEGSDLTREFCYYLMLTDKYASNSLGYTSGTTVLHLNKDAISMFEFCFPNSNLIGHFSKIANDIHNRIFIAEKESNILAQVRDALLPKLISGELRIPDAEKFLEQAGI